MASSEGASDPAGRPDSDRPASWTPPPGWSPEQPAPWPTGRPAPAQPAPGWGTPQPAPGQPSPPPQQWGAPPGPPPPPQQWGPPQAAPPPQQWGPPQGPAQPPPGPPPPGYGPPPPGYGQPQWGQPQAGWGQPQAGWGQSPGGAPAGWVPPPQAPKPGIIPLRPLGIGELLEGGLGFIRSNPRTILGLAAILAGVVAVVQTLGAWAALVALDPHLDSLLTGDLPAELTGEMGELLAISLAQALPGVVTGLLQVVASGLFIVLVAAAVLGRSLDSGGTWRLLRPRLAGLIGLTLVLVLGGLLVVALTVGATVGLVALLGPAGVFVAILLALAVTVGLVVVYVRVAVAAPALVLEGIGAFSAVGRSWQLVRGSWWRVAGVLVLTAMVSALLTAVVSVPVGLLTSALFGFEPSTAAAVVSSGLTALVAGIVTWPFTAAVSGLLYVDLRMRRERLDQTLVAAADQPAGAADPLVAYRRR